jgi:hypothetical protein
MTASAHFGISGITGALFIAFGRPGLAVKAGIGFHGTRPTQWLSSAPSPPSAQKVLQSIEIDVDHRRRE